MVQDQIDAIGLSIFEGYKEYIIQFKDITLRAKKRFETKDWHGIHDDSTERLLLYKESSRNKAEELKKIIDSDRMHKPLWRKIKLSYSSVISSENDLEIAETFFNSVVRKLFDNMVIDAETMFVYLERELQEMQSETELYNTYSGDAPPKEIVRKVLNDYSHNVNYENLERDIGNIVSAIQYNLISDYPRDPNSRVEILKSVFYRNKAAYIVGRICTDGNLLPFILPLLHGKNGVCVDTVVFDPNLVSVMFSFTRSYFLVDVEVPFDMINFLKTLMPHKRYSELYNSIGFNKHGKTVFYRSLLNHLDKSNDKFIVAPGIKGMVMTVFTLPSYPVVFKLIKDKFDPPKKLSRDQVKAKYKYVSNHDRVGRMADTHEFEDFILPKDRFSEELLEELNRTVPSLIHEKDNYIIIDHLYTERRMIPLNIYLESATEKDADIIVRDYGNAIKQLAAADIFPGDMLLKNFGVTRHGRVVFYDYDEITRVVDCRFREIPEPRDDFETYSSEAWYSVEENDIFPEEFRKFLIGRSEIRDLFFKYHADLFSAKYWNSIKSRLRSGEIVDVYPYPDDMKFCQ